ncbi:hypothetical protein D046_1486B, partial [Vibrio parahaemolyticus V-223/04]
VLNKNQSVSY